MNTKLTLTIEKEVFEKVKKFAQSRDRCLSDLVENYLIALTSEEIQSVSNSTPLVNSMKGSFKV